MAEEKELTVVYPIYFAKGRHGRKKICIGEPPPELPPEGQLLRITRLMALAIHYQACLENGTYENQADIARKGLVSQMRVSHLMELNMLAPAIQEELLFWPKKTRGRDPIIERQLRPIANTPNWDKQMALWAELKRGIAST
jgi:hypothetical protein